jgi:nucleoside-diphosphate-sugar epimerase
MKVLIAGGSGFLGTALKNMLIHNSHEVFILTRGRSQGRNQIHWDGKTADGWGHLVNEMDSVRLGTLAVDEASETEVRGLARLTGTCTSFCHRKRNAPPAGVSAKLWYQPLWLARSRDC